MKTRWLKTIIVATVFAVIFVPVAINYLCLTVFPAPLVGDGKLWLGFWGSYLGGIIAVLSTFMFFTEITKWSIIAKRMKSKKSILIPYVLTWESYVLLLILIYFVSI